MKTIINQACNVWIAIVWNKSLLKQQRHCLYCGAEMCCVKDPLSQAKQILNNSKLVAGSNCTDGVQDRAHYICWGFSSAGWSGAYECHILRHLVCHLVHKRITQLMEFGGYNHPVAVSRPWNWEKRGFSVHSKGRNCPNPSLPFCERIIYQGIDRSLKTEWNRRLVSSKAGSALRELLPTVGEVWMTWSADRGSTFDLLATTRFITGALPYWNVCSTLARK